MEHNNAYYMFSQTVVCDDPIPHSPHCIYFLADEEMQEVSFTA